MSNENRTIQITHNEFNILLRALGIAESQVSKVRDSYFRNLVNVRGTNKQELASEWEGFLNLENQFSDLLDNLKHGKRDV
jgi:hypothetical protein